MKKFQTLSMKQNKTYWNSTIRIKKKKKVRHHKKIKQIPLPKLKKQLWEVIKVYIKLRDGKMCVSCRKREGTQTGHYLPKSACNLIYKYYEKNLGRQCAYCNLYLKGNAVEYRKYQIKKWGLKSVEEMERSYNLPLPLNFSPRPWIMDNIKWYKRQISSYRKIL